MASKYSFLIKKELRDFFRSYKCVLMVLFITLFPIIWKFKGKVMPDVIYIAFFQMAQGQFIYDSFLNDTREKGSLFFINMKIPFESQFLIKMLVAFSQVLVSVLVNFRDIASLFSLIDILWIVPIIFQSSFLMFIGTIISGGAELSTALSVTVIIFAITFAVLLSPVILRILISLGLLTLTYLISKKMFFSKIYRSQL